MTSLRITAIEKGRRRKQNYSNKTLQIECDGQDKNVNAATVAGF